MNVTLYSDASLCQKTGVAAWAGWVKSDRGTTRAHGVLKAKTTDTTIAEAMAVVNMISVALKQEQLCDQDLLVIVTDNDNVMSVLHGDARRKPHRKSAARRRISVEQRRVIAEAANQLIGEISGAYSNILDRHQLVVRWYHVKGHRGTGDKRSAVNHGCDERAKQALALGRKQHQDQQQRKRRQRKRRRRATTNK